MAAYKIKKASIPPEIMNVVKAHHFYVEEYRKAKDFKNIEMIEYYTDKMRSAENAITFNLHKYL